MKMNWSEHAKIQRKEMQKQIEELQEKLKALEEKSPAEEAYKRVYDRYPITDIRDTCWDGSSWEHFREGYITAKGEGDVVEPSMTNCILEGNPPNGYVAWNVWYDEMGSQGILHNLKISSKDYQPTPQEPEDNEWKTVALGFGENLSAIGPCGYYDFSPGEWVEWALNAYEKTADDYLSLLKKEKVKVKKSKELIRESVKWCEEHPDESVEEYLKPHTPEKTEKLLREAFQKVQQTEEWKETQRKIDSNYDELVESGTEPPEPTSTVFRQKLFDGIKSVFYDPDYERTHWKLKVDMAVDEVLTHFYDIIPEPQEPVYDEFAKGRNCCLAEIKMCMEHTDD